MSQSELTNQCIGAIRRLFVGLHRPGGGRVPREAVITLVATRFSTFTVTDTLGYYEGTPEPTLVIEIAAPGGPPIEDLARDLADTFDQDAVGIESGGIYTRVFGKRSRETRQGAPRDHETLQRFLTAIQSGRPFEKLDPDLQAWWLNRY